MDMLQGRRKDEGPNYFLVVGLCLAGVLILSGLTALAMSLWKKPVDASKLPPDARMVSGSETGQSDSDSHEKVLGDHVKLAQKVNDYLVGLKPTEPMGNVRFHVWDFSNHAVMLERRALLAEPVEEKVFVESAKKTTRELIEGNQQTLEKIRKNVELLPGKTQAAILDFYEWYEGHPARLFALSIKPEGSEDSIPLHVRQLGKQFAEAMQKQDYQTAVATVGEMDQLAVQVSETMAERGLQQDGQTVEIQNVFSVMVQYMQGEWSEVQEKDAKLAFVDPLETLARHVVEMGSVPETR
ncbi:hypothetical protein [Lacunimicrobium album]